MNLFVCISDPISPAQVFSNILTVIRYRVALEAGERIELVYYENAALDKVPEHGLLHDIATIPNEALIEVLKTLKPEVLFKNIPTNSTSPEAGLHQVVYLLPTETIGLVPALKEIEGFLHVPVFSPKHYGTLRDAAIKAGMITNTMFTMYRSLSDVAALASRTTRVSGAFRLVTLNIATIIGWLKNGGAMDFVIDSQEGEGFYSCSIEVRPAYVGYLQLVDRPVEQGVKTSSVYEFLVPSFGKRCGIGDYHKHQREEIYRISGDNPVCITARRLDELMLVTNTVFIHHEFLLFYDGYLSENNHEELIDFIDSHRDIKFPIFLHTVPGWEIIENDVRLNYIDALLAMKNVYPIVMNRVMHSTLQAYPSMKRSGKKIAITDLGLYSGIESQPSSESARHLMLFGFNNPGKGYQEVVDTIMTRTAHNLLIVGRGSSALKIADQNRVWCIDEYLPEDKLLALMRGHVLAVICNRTAGSTSSSASYRDALATGVPVFASDNIAHTSLKDFTQDSRLTYFADMDELLTILDKLDGTDRLYELRQKSYDLSVDLKKKWSIGRTSLDVMRSFAP